jgi:hypothetical protein
MRQRTVLAALLISPNEPTWYFSIELHLWAGHVVQELLCPGANYVGDPEIVVQQQVSTTRVALPTRNDDSPGTTRLSCTCGPGPGPGLHLCRVPIAAPQADRVSIKKDWRA